MDSPYRYQFGSSTYTLDQLRSNAKYLSAEASVIAVGSDTPGDENLVHVLESQDALAAWAKNTSLAEAVARAQDSIAQAQALKGQDLSDRKQQMKAEAEQALSDLQSLAKSTGLEWPSEELFRQAHGTILKSAALFDKAGYSGWDQFCLLVSAFPYVELGWFGWNDRASSLWHYGVGVLSEHPWYLGRSIWMFGWTGLPNLAWLDFDNMASSYWSAA
jgi:hypothetical protein